MYILGLNCYAHDSAAAIIKDGVLIGSAEEERFVREKHVGDFPKNAIAWCCHAAGISPTDIDHIVYYWQPRTAVFQRALHMIRYFPMSIQVAYRRLDNELPMLSLKKTFAKEFGITKKTHFHNAEHHLCHAASSFYLSPFNDSAILTIDGNGEWDSTWLGTGSDIALHRIKSVTFPHSLGVVYTAITDFLGFRANSGEGKIMGLAPYGDPDRYYDHFKNMMIDKRDGSFAIDLSYFQYHYRGKDNWFSNKFLNIFGPWRHADDPLEQRHKDIAAALQKRVEEIGVSLARWLYSKTKNKRLCLAGGVCLNSVMNGKILEQTDFTDLYIQPAAHDAGTSIGACYWLWHKIYKKPRAFYLDTPYLGPSYTDQQYAKEIDLLKDEHECAEITIEKVAEPSLLAAKCIAEGKIIGWFQGKMEIGPRALGNRSILADPRDPAMKDTLNSRVKFREEFRPFAPSILEEELSTWFTQCHPSPFMLLVYDVIPEKRALVPSITHIDGTGRVQSVTRKMNNRYYDLIKEFDKLTGVPIVLNTSFNIRGEPIVNTPREAIACFLRTGIDTLFLGDYVLTKTEEYKNVEPQSLQQEASSRDDNIS